VVYVVIFIRTLAQIYTFIVFLHIILSYFLSPFHPIREAIDRIVEPVLSPIRQRIPPVGMFDFSALVLIFLIQIVVSLVTNFLLMI